jgi:alpha-tubulin suppressor-like RCC1 family protein
MQRVTQVSCGWRHTVALTDRGNIYSWGRGTSGQLGHGDAVDRNEPKRIELLSVDGLACWQIECSQPDNATDDQVAATRIPACDDVEPNKMLIGVRKKTRP